MNTRNIYVTLWMLSLCMITSSFTVKEKSRVKKSINNSNYSTAEDAKETNSSRTSNISLVTVASEIGLKKVKGYFKNMTTTTRAPIFTIDSSIFNAKFNECVAQGTTIYLDPEDFQSFSNGSAFVPLYNMMFDRSNHLIRDNLLFLCSDIHEGENNRTTGQQKFPPSIGTVSVVCVVISAVCIILHIVMFILVKRLRNLPGYCLLSLCVALLLAYLCSFIQLGIHNPMGCTVIGMFLLYFFLASFFWMNTMSYDVWRSIRVATTQLRLTADKPILVRFVRYSIYAWGIPLMIIIISIIVHNYTSEIKYTLIFDIETCWFSNKQALTVYFAIPLFTLLGMNVIFFASSFYMITMASMSKSQFGSQSGSDLWSRLFLSLRLASVMGFMWIFGIIAAAAEVLWLWYFYSVCNALQGVFIFFSFTVNERTRKDCKKVLQGRKESSTPTQTTSSQNTTTV